MVDWRSLDQTYVMSTYNRLPIAIERGEGNILYDTEGKAYLDLFTGLAVSVLGHSHPAILKALREQGEKFLHISNIFLNQPAITLAKRLVENSISGKVFFTNSGAEATEAAIKLIHKWTKQNGSVKSGVVVLKNSFHGRTLGALRLTRQAHVYQDFPQPAYPVYEVEPGDAEAIRAICATEAPAAVLMEPVLGSGGVIPLDTGYLQQAAQICREYGVLLCIDEIQTGMGRTGKLFAYQHTDIKPDLVLFAKGVGGGLPLGGVIAGEQLQDLFKPGDHGTTFAPAPLSAALGNAVLDVILEEGFLAGVSEQAAYLKERVEGLISDSPDIYKEIRGKGMMVGIVMNLPAEQVSALQKELLNQGILVDVTQKVIVRLLPPLTLSKEEIDLFIDVFSRIASQFTVEKGA